MRRAKDISQMFRKHDLAKAFNFQLAGLPYMTIAIHQGSTIEGAIGSEFKTDACYLSPHMKIVNRIEALCEYYDMQILLSESIYNLMSLKAR